MALPANWRETPAWLPALNPFAWVQRAVGTFSPAAAPPMSRANYARELIAATFLSWVAAVIEGNVIGVIVDRYFEGAVSKPALALAVSVLAAAPSFANITSFVFVRLSHGRHKVRAVNLLQVAVALFAAAMAVADRSPGGLALVVTATVAARMAMAGIVTIRSAVWRANYPRESRAKLTGRIAMVQMGVLAVIGMAITQVMDANEELFRVAVPIAAGVSMIGVWSWGRIRVRGHAALLNAERASDGSDGPSLNPLTLVAVLRQDPRFARYMLLHFLIGMGNMMAISPIILMTKDRFNMGYFEAGLITQGIPQLMMPLTIPLWSALLDRWHVVRFRAHHTWVFVAMMASLVAAGVSGWVWVLYVSAAVRGVAFAGGALAWNLGHNDFARDDNAAQYMSVHVTLTGIRGMLAPFLGTWLYAALADRGPLGGSWVFAIAGVMLVVGALGFNAMHREMRASEAARGG